MPLKGPWDDLWEGSIVLAEINGLEWSCCCDHHMHHCSDRWPFNCTGDNPASVIPASNMSLLIASPLFACSLSGWLSQLETQPITPHLMDYAILLHSDILPCCVPPCVTHCFSHHCFDEWYLIQKIPLLLVSPFRSILNNESTWILIWNENQYEPVKSHLYTKKQWYTLYTGEQRILWN